MLRRLSAMRLETTPRAKGIPRILDRRGSGRNLGKSYSIYERVIAPDALRKINLKLTQLSPDEREVCKHLVKYIESHKNASIEDIVTLGTLFFRKKPLTMWVSAKKSKLPLKDRPKARSVGVENSREMVGELTSSRATWLMKYLIKQGIIVEKKG